MRGRKVGSAKFKVASYDAFRELNNLYSPISIAPRVFNIETYWKSSLSPAFTCATGFIRHGREFSKGRRISPKDRVGRRRSVIPIMFALCCALS